MALALVSTSQLEPVSATRAFCALSSSSLAAVHDLQQGAQSDDAPLVQAHALPNSHRRAGSSLTLRRSRASFTLLGVPGALSVTFGGSSRLGSHSFRDQPLHKVAVPVVIHLSNVLSCLTSPAGSTNASKGSQALGKVIHERGKVVQGGGRYD